MGKLLPVRSLITLVSTCFSDTLTISTLLTIRQGVAFELSPSPALLPQRVRVIGREGIFRLAGKPPK